jgi:hypothetical protein
MLGKDVVWVPGWIMQQECHGVSLNRHDVLFLSQGWTMRESQHKPSLNEVYSSQLVRLGMTSVVMRLWARWSENSYRCMFNPRIASSFLPRMD